MISKKTRAEHAAIWRRFRAEISHMRPIQAQKLKLIEVCILGKLNLSDVTLPLSTLIHLKLIPIRETLSGEGAPVQRT